MPGALPPPEPAPAPAPAATAKPQLGSFGFDVAGMDRSVAPGEDFYAFSNGAWAKNTPIPADKSNYGMFTALDDLSKERVRQIEAAAFQKMRKYLEKQGGEVQSLLA